MVMLKQSIAPINIDKNETNTTLKLYPYRKKFSIKTTYSLYISKVGISHSKANLRVMLQ